MFPFGRMLNGRYKINGVLGHGEHGDVYQARDMNFPNVTRHVAVKEILIPKPGPLALTEIERCARRFRSAENMCKVFDYFSDERHLYVVSEFIDGRDLQAIIKGVHHFLPSKVVLRIATEVCSTLVYLHSPTAVVIFGELKPAHIMFNKQGQTILIDLGITKMARGEQDNLVSGMDGYATPEYYRGKEASPAGDIYSLGACLHYALTRQDPRREASFSFNKRPIRSVNPDVSAELEAVIMRAVRSRPHNRYPTALAMLRDLEQVPEPQNLEHQSSAGERPALKPLSDYTLELRSGTMLLGVLSHVSLEDWPWFNAEFEATAEFENFREQFEKEYGQFQNVGDKEGWITAHKKIDSVALTANVPGKTNQARVILLHVVGKRAKFRLIVEDWAR